MTQTRPTQAAAGCENDRRLFRCYFLGIKVPTAAGLYQLEVLAETSKFLGTPSLLRVIGEGSMQSAVARWQYEDASVTASPSSLLRVSINLLSGQRSLARPGTRVTRRVSVGSVAVLPPGTGASVETRGAADVLQIFVPVDNNGVCADLKNPAFGLDKQRIRGMALQVLMALTRGCPDDQLLVEENVRQIGMVGLDLLGSQSDPTVRPDKPYALAPHVLRRLDEFVDGELTRPDPNGGALTLERMAAVANMSVNHLIRSFRHDVGQTPYKYVVRRRMDRAFDLLKDRRQTVGSVADATGFAQPAHFVATFRQAFGVTPGALRFALL